MVLRDALERAGNADRAKLREALAATNLADHILPQGPIQFDKTGENANAQSALLQNQGGKNRGRSVRRGQGRLPRSSLVALTFRPPPAPPRIPGGAGGRPRP